MPVLLLGKSKTAFNYSMKEECTVIWSRRWKTKHNLRFERGEFSCLLYSIVILFCWCPKAELVKTTEQQWTSLTKALVMPQYVLFHYWLCKNTKCFRMQIRFIQNNFMGLPNGLYFFCVVELCTKLKKNWK